MSPVGPAWRIAPTHRRGFSLLEVVVAVALFAVLMVTTLTWIVRQGALSRTIAHRMEDLAVLEAVARLLRDDLLQAVAVPQGGRCTVATGRLSCTTLNRVPDEVAGYHQVVWESDPTSGSLTRVSRTAEGVASPRVVSERFRQVSFTGSGAQVALTVSGRGGPELTVRVWSEAPDAEAGR